MTADKVSLPAAALDAMSSVAKDVLASKKAEKVTVYGKFGVLNATGSDTITVEIGGKVHEALPLLEEDGFPEGAYVLIDDVKAVE